MKKIYIAAGYNTTFMGPGRPEFDPKHLRPFEDYLLETAKGTSSQLPNCSIDEGVIGSFMSARFLNQANLPGFLPFMVPELSGKPCVAVEGACGTGGRAITTAIRAALSGLADTVFVAGFEMQNQLKPIYGADVLAGAAYYKKERKDGLAHFFPGLFSERAGAYPAKNKREAMASWYERMITNARLHPKSQEYYNKTGNLYEKGMMPPGFTPHLNLYDCSKVSDGASSLIVCTEEGLKKCGLKKQDAVELISMGEAQRDITKPPPDLMRLSTTEIAIKRAQVQTSIDRYEIHDCFSITAILSIEALGLCKNGQGADWILEGNPLPINGSGGLSGFGHPTGATGVRQMVDLLHHLQPGETGMMVNMGGNDVTVSALVVKKN